MILWELFFTFVKIGFVSFGGGYAIIPVIQQQVIQNGWMTTKNFTDVIAVSGMSPGPIATNSAIFVGYHTAGLGGAIVSAVGMVIPSLLIVILVATFFYKINDNVWVQNAMYGLRAVVTGLIFYGAIQYAQSNGIIGEITTTSVLLIGLFGVCLFVLASTRVHPLVIILASGLVGVMVF